MTGATSLPHSAALERIARSVLALTSASSVWVARTRPGSVGLQVVTAVGVHPSGPLTLAPESAPPVIGYALELAARDPYLLTSGDLEADVRFAGIVETRPYGSLLVAPLYENQRVFAALVVARARAQDFDERQRQLALVYAEQIAMTFQLLESVALHETQARERASLLAATRALTSRLDAQAVIAAIASEIPKVIACRAAVIYRYEEPSSILRVVAVTSDVANPLSGVTIALSDPRSLAARVALERAPRYNVVAQGNEAGALTGALTAAGEAWLICEPLVASGRLLGVIMLARSRAFEASEQRALGAFSALAAAALERGMLFDSIRAQRDQRDAMFAAASDAIAQIDREQLFVEVNQAFANNLDSDPASLRGQACCVALNGSPGEPPTPETCLLCHGACHVRECLQQGEPLGPFVCAFPPPPDMVSSGATPTAAPQARGREVAFILTPIPGPAGRHALLIGRDITNEVERERQRMEFLETLAHEAVQPLTTVTANLELALFYSPPDTPLAERQRMEQLALLATRQAAANVADIVAVSQRDFGHFSVDPVVADLSSVARDIAAEVAALAVAHGVRLESDCPANLPLARLDPMRAQQVARNLLMNALKFTPPGGWVRITTRAGTGRDEGWIELIVEDSGPGIPPEHHERVFERRFQSATPLAPGRQKGAGMGLAVVRYIMDGHGGGHSASNRPGGGAILTVRFPRAASPGAR